MRCLLLLLCIALYTGFLSAQEVNPQLNYEYRALLRKQPAGSIQTDTTNSLNRSRLQYKGYGFYTQVVPGRIRKKGNLLIILPQKKYSLHIGGIYSTAGELLRVNRLPALQNEYAQGRNAGGLLQWQGPETNELFSYGPLLAQLEYDGNPYVYDVNGKLVLKGNGNGKRANVYNNSVFRTGFLWNNSLHLNTRLLINGYTPLLVANLQTSQSREKNIIRSNRILHQRLMGSLEGYIKKFTIKGSYSLREESSRLNNRTGFLNRIYRYSLLTPSSFNNKQEPGLSSGGQHSYSNLADNPGFLQNHTDRDQNKQQQHIYALNLRRDWNKLRLNFTQQWEYTTQQQTEQYPAGTAGLPAGYFSQRDQTDRQYRLQFNGTYDVRIDDDIVRGPLQLNYIYTTQQTTVQYINAGSYRYQRSSSDLAVSFAPVLDNYLTAGGITLTGKIYTSNTTRNSYFLPSIGGFYRRNDFLGLSDLFFRIKGQYNVSNSELPLNRSYAGVNLLHYDMGTVNQYTPQQEVIYAHHTVPIQHREALATAELSYRNKITLTVQWFNRSIANDIYPVYQSGRWQFENLAGHRNRGIEIDVNLSPRFLQNKDFTMSHNLGFTSYRSKVTQIKEGYENSPLYGFAGIQKILVKGRPFGLIAGTDFLRNAQGVVVTGSDGFPMVNPNTVIIGDPNPDFIFKTTHALNWKLWGFSIDWEWRKGGDIWNGTKALLDYYGRSAPSAAERNITGYVFNGVQPNGAHNTIAVDFYNPALPLSQHHRVRYGETGVGAAYIEKGDYLRLNYAGFTRKFKIRKSYRRLVTLALYTRNLFIWQAYKGADPNQLLYDIAGSSGLDFFNLPSARSFGFSASVQF